MSFQLRGRRHATAADLGNSLPATYKRNTGATLPVTGGLVDAKPHQLTIHIQFDPGNNQQFDLLHHTWEKGIFSRTTYWGGHTYGVQGFKE